MSKEITIQQTPISDTNSINATDFWANGLTWKDYAFDLPKALLTQKAPSASSETYLNWVYAICKAKVSHVLAQLEAIPEPVLQLPSLPPVIQGMLIAPFIDQLDCTADSLKTWFSDVASAQKVELNLEATPNSSARTINRWLRHFHGELIDGFKTQKGETLESFRDGTIICLEFALTLPFEKWQELADGAESKGTREPLPEHLEELITKTIEDFFIALGPVDKETSIMESKAVMKLCQKFQARRSEELPKLKNTEPRPGGNAPKEGNATA